MEYQKGRGKTPFRTPSYVGSAERSDQLPMAISKHARQDELPVLLHKTRAKEFMLNDEEHLKEYIAVLNQAVNNEARIYFLERQWVPEAKTHCVLCEWSTGFIDAPDQGVNKDEQNIPPQLR